MEIRNIYCIGRNYVNHAKELGNRVPESPLVFSKPTSALTIADGKPIHYSNKYGDIHHELEIVLYIGKVPTEQSQVGDAVTKMALGIDLTRRDLQTKLKEKGHPWLLAKGFPNAAIVTDFWDFPGTGPCETVDFSLQKNGKTVQSGNIQSMIFSFQTLLEYLQQQFGLQEGDIIYTGTPEGVGPIHHNDRYVLKWGEEVKGSFTVLLQP